MRCWHDKQKLPFQHYYDSKEAKSDRKNVILALNVTQNSIHHNQAIKTAQTVKQNSVRVIYVSVLAAGIIDQDLILMPLISLHLARKRFAAGIWQKKRIRSFYGGCWIGTPNQFLRSNNEL